MSNAHAADAPEFVSYPDLASRALGSSVVAADDELFAQWENLITARAPAFDPGDFGHKGKVYDGWETRRRRDQGNDWAIVRLGAAGIIHGVVVDTAWFRGNYPPFVSVEAVVVDGYPSVAELVEADWQMIVAKSDSLGDSPNYYAVDSDRRWTHVRLSIYPDGGVARFRVHGEAVPDPRFLTGTIDLLAAENGAGSPSPRMRSTPRRPRSSVPGGPATWGSAGRTPAAVGTATTTPSSPSPSGGTIRHLEVDTGYYVGNAPGWVRVSVADLEDGTAEGALETATWTDVLAKVAVQPDTRHRFLSDAEVEATHLRLDVYPDGGLSRLRAWGGLSDEQLRLARRRYDESRAS
ncbi:MAG: allantoicase [Actinomycetales bacterium]|nr:allantoicase [Actinomycetales bacterium]